MIAAVIIAIVLLFFAGGVAAHVREGRPVRLLPRWRK